MRAPGVQTNPLCTATRHGSQGAWTVGCRCHDALLAHDRKLARDRERSSELWASRSIVEPKQPAVWQVPRFIVDSGEPDYVSVWLAVDGKLSFSRLESEAARVAVVVELARTFDLTKIADLLGIGWDQARRLYARRELVAA